MEGQIKEIIDEFTHVGVAAQLVQVLRENGLTSLGIFSGISSENEESYVNDFEAFLLAAAPNMEISDVRRSLVLIRTKALVRDRPKPSNPPRLAPPPHARGIIPEGGVPRQAGIFFGGSLRDAI